MSSQAVSLNLIVKNPDEEFRLIEEALDGSCDAFKTLFTRNVTRVYSLCLRISADQYIAEEITQEVFIKAWEKLRSFQFDSKFSSWLHRIAVNQFLMHIRSEKRNSEREEEYGKVRLNHDLNRSTDNKIDLENAISKLPAQARAVLVLYDIEGYKHKEISEFMNIEIGTSKAHLHRARKILREELSK